MVMASSSANAFKISLISVLQTKAMDHVYFDLLGIVILLMNRLTPQNILYGYALAF